MTEALFESPVQSRETDERYAALLPTAGVPVIAVIEENQ